MTTTITRKRHIRLQGYDYSYAGGYFITICSHNRSNIFGEYDKNIVGTALAAVRDNIHNKNNIKLSKLGQIIDNQWSDIPNQYKNVQLDQYVIMPNHIHGILIIDNRTGASPVPTISNIIGSFKSKTSVEYLRYINENNFDISGKIWQRSFHDNVIYNDKSLSNIREYITNNPATWDNDENNIVGSGYSRPLKKKGDGLFLGKHKGAMPAPGGASPRPSFLFCR